jgi:hypothetical protein
MAAVGEQPKRPQNAYWLFLAENREKFEKLLPDGAKKGPGVAKVAGDKWKALTDKDRKPYEDKAAELKANFEKNMAKFVAAGGEVQKRIQKNSNAESKRQKAAKNPNKPKRPQNAYWLFLAENRQDFENLVPEGVKKGPGVAKVAGDKWKALSAEKRKVFDVKAAALREEYIAAMEKYKSENPDAADEEEEGEEEEGEDDPVERTGAKGKSVEPEKKRRKVAEAGA